MIEHIYLKGLYENNLIIFFINNFVLLHFCK